MYIGFLVFTLFINLSTQNSKDSEDSCWSPWSPCSLNCIPYHNDNRTVSELNNYAMQWRKKWSSCQRPHSAPEVQLQKCPFRNNTPYCLQDEGEFPGLSTRTSLRIVALVMACCIIAIPTMSICLQYTSGHPLLCCRRRPLESVREKPITVAKLPKTRGFPSTTSSRSFSDEDNARTRNTARS